ncbi:hypothetical protein D3OALGA1CA_1536 [Olavius algarvensis associated proteobacterium Delta 3]|nr:hypothetical protein D3OALGB2SA_337 [Olavius algarvensis associated proteobacterium Delta 3]CAB5102641.1 hypothetical protein D3OALGA1CA_1536 [Olavius algarvensis associated proteobacterium Delta 3]
MTSHSEKNLEPEPSLQPVGTYLWEQLYKRVHLGYLGRVFLSRLSVLPKIS